MHACMHACMHTYIHSCMHIKITEFRVINSQKLKMISEMDTPYLIPHPRGIASDCVAIKSEVMFSLTISKRF